jgi:Peptidase family S41
LILDRTNGALQSAEVETTVLVRPLLRLALLIVTVAVVRGAALGDCKLGDPAGNFAGTALSRQAGKLEVSFSLRCSNGHYEGELNTSVGNFSVNAGTFEAGQLHLQLVADGSTVTIEAKLEGDRLQGNFVSDDDQGTIDLLPIANPAKSGSNLSKQQWREDLAFFVRELPRRHANAFHYTPREKFEAAAAALDEQIDHLNPDEIYVGLDRLANLIGDAHTYVEFPANDANLPIEIRRFGDAYRVVAVVQRNEKGLGARVVGIENTPIARARELATSLTPQDETPELASARIEGFLTTGMALHGLRITADRSVAHYSLAGKGGQGLNIEVRALPAATEPQWVSAIKELPLSGQDPENMFRCKYLADARTLYCNVRQILNLTNPAREMLGLVDRQRPDKLVIDLRQNSGGDFNEGLKHLIHPIGELKNINRKGHLFVLIGPNTFSAAMSNAAQFRGQTEAMLVGQMIGERPNSYQESRQVTLPNSGWVVHYSTQYYKFVESGENIIRPDKEIIPSWEDYVAGRDPVLDWVLNRKAE